MSKEVIKTKTKNKSAWKIVECALAIGGLVIALAGGKKKQ